MFICGCRCLGVNFVLSAVKPSNGNMQLPGLENPLPGLASQNCSNLVLDRVERPHEKSQAWEQMNKELGHQKMPLTSTKKKAKYCGASVRRSERIKSTVVSPPKTNCGIEVIDDITVSESEKEEVDTLMEHVMAEQELEPESEPETETEPELADNLGQKKSVDEKVDRALQRIDALDKIVDSLKAKVGEHLDLYESPSVSYKNMYMDSQKKIEELTFENQRLNGKLENALGKIEVYEKEMLALIDVVDKTKDAVKDAMISNMAKTIEAAVNVSTQAIHNACSTSAVKKKKSEI